MEFGLEPYFFKTLMERPTADFTAALPLYLHILGTTSASTVDYYRYQLDLNLEHAKIELSLTADHATGATISSQQSLEFRAELRDPFGLASDLSFVWTCPTELGTYCSTLPIQSEDNQISAEGYIDTLAGLPSNI